MVITHDIVATDRLPCAEYAAIVRRTIFDCCKWDPQVEDVATLAPFALVLGAETWQDLARDAESLAAETATIERELLHHPDLHAALSLPRPIVRAMRNVSDVPRSIARVMRFDFHLTTDGWRISEVNCDVPGGFIEASGFSELVAGQHPELRMAGDPAAELANAFAAALKKNASVALVHATAYTDDRQVMVFLARHFEAVGLRACLVAPNQIDLQPVDAIFRFFPAEWLPNLGRTTDWRRYFQSSNPPQCNPATTLLTQSKRLPLIWDELDAPTDTWRRLLPETRDLREVRWQQDADWVVKPALGRVGDGIGLSGVTSAKDWKSIHRSAYWFPRHWIAQRRFRSVPIDTPIGPQHACIGVYTIDGRASGIYGRIAPRPLLDHRARDVAVLIERSEHVW